MGRLNRFEDHRYIGTRDDMVAHDCNDEEAFGLLEDRAAKDGLLAQNLLQSFAPDSLVEARNRGFRPA